MKILKLLFILIISFSSSLFFVNANEVLNLNGNSDYFVYSNFLEYKNSSTNKIGYIIYYDKSIEGNLSFNLNLKFNDKNYDKICNYDLEINKNTIFRKIVCEIPKLGTGTYEFKANLIKGVKIVGALNNIYEIKPKILKINNSNSTILFEYLNDNQTKITLNILEVGENFIIENEIPKEVIKFLDENNKDELISSNLTYKILKNDPLIAWTVDKVPTKIEYKINKKVNSSDIKNFKLEIKENKSLKLFKNIALILIVIILILILKPLIKRKVRKIKKIK